MAEKVKALSYSFSVKVPPGWIAVAVWLKVFCKKSYASNSAFNAFGIALMSGGRYKT